MKHSVLRRPRIPGTAAARRALLAALVGALAACQAGEPSLETGPTNVILMTIDTLRADHLSVYGYERETSPNLDRLAAEGARFTNSYSQASSTVPTHASLFTGRYPFQHRTFGQRTPLPDEELTLAEVFHGRGYRTFSVSSSIRFHEQSGFPQGFDRYHTLVRVPKDERNVMVTDRVLAEIDAGAEAPFFAFVHYIGPHAPYMPPEPYRTRWHPGLPEPKPRRTAEFLQTHRDQELAPGVLDYLRALYDGEILYVDAEIARLFAGLEQRGLDESTLVVITSDHGEEFKEHGGLSHFRHLHEELLRVPLIVRWPGRIAPGIVVETQATSADLLPTILDLLRVEPPAGLAGRSLAGPLLGESPPARAGEEGEVTFAQLTPDTWALYATRGQARFKLLVDHGAPPVLFHLDSDPSGSVPVEARYPEDFAALLQLAEELGVGGNHRVGAAKTIAIDEDVRERLRALGYAEEADAGE